MDIKILVPQLGESIVTGNVSDILKKEGDVVKEGDIICLLDTDKVSIEVTSTTSGIITKISVQVGDDVEIGSEIAIIDKDAKVDKDTENVKYNNDSKKDIVSKKNIDIEDKKIINNDNEDILISPAAKKKIKELQIDKSAIPRTGKHGMITKEDVLNSLEQISNSNDSSNNSIPNTNNINNNNSINNNITDNISNFGEKMETRVKMSQLRQSIIKNLKTSQDNIATLTTFNKIRMDNIINIRKKYKDIFQKTHDVKLGYMSFFIKASIYALQKIKSVNAQIEENDIIYKYYYNIGIAVSTEKGLVVPVLKNADRLNVAEIEKEILSYATKARNMELQINDMTNGTFTISNGGVYGSLLSIPILNYPQSAILGLHSIQKEAVVDENDNIVIGNTMYVALSYDHRIIDGKEAINFLKIIKEYIEDPLRMILDI